MELQDLFSRYAGHSMEAIGYNLQQLHRLRIRADYDPTVPHLEEAAARALRMAKRLLDDIGNLPADPTQAP